MCKRLLTRCCLIIAGVALAFSVSAAKKEDPLRPPEYRTKTVTSAKKETVTRWYVNEILISGERRVAIINNTAVARGEKVNGARVVDITPEHVVLEYRDKVIYAQLALMDIKKKTTKNN